MDEVLIELYRNRNSERWLIVSVDGKITMHTETNVYGVLTGHREVTDAPITLEEVRVFNPAVAAACEAAIEAMRARAVASSPDGDERDGRAVFSFSNEKEREGAP